MSVEFALVHYPVVGFLVRLGRTAHGHFVEIMSNNTMLDKTNVQHTINIHLDIVTLSSPCLGFVHDREKKSNVHNTIHPP